MSISNRPYAKDFFEYVSRHYTETVEIKYYPDFGASIPFEIVYSSNEQKMYYGKYASTCALLSLDGIIAGQFGNVLGLSDVTLSLAKATPQGNKRYVYLFAKYRGLEGDYYITYTLTEIIWE